MTTKRVLMCRPDYYGIRYEINPWMSIVRQPNMQLAHTQWEKLVSELEKAGLAVRLIRPVFGLPDMVFTANGGLARGNTVVVSNFRHKERRGEVLYFRNYFLSLGYRCEMTPEEMFFEGEGDALFCGDRLACGYGFRSDEAGVKFATHHFGKVPVMLKLVDPHFYHLDTCFCYPKKNVALCYLPAFDSDSRRRIELLGEIISVSEQDAKNFVCNAVPVGNKLITSPMSGELRSRLEKSGIEPVEVEMSEFIKAGGAAKCLTLFLGSGIPANP